MRQKTVLVAGVLAIALGIGSAVLRPATAYELSIYSSTPLPFWIGVAIALAIGCWYGLYHRGPWRASGLVLGSGATVAIVLLPLLRGYYYYGYRDGLTQLGTVQSVLAGDPWAERVIYPLLHLLSASLTAVTGLPPRATMVGLIAVFAVVYLLGTLLLARELAGDRRGISLAVIGSWMLLPLMTVRLPTLSPIPTTMAAFSAPVIVALILRSGRGTSSWRWHVLALGGVITSILVHPILTTFLAAVTSVVWLLSSGIRAAPIDRPSAPVSLSALPFLIGVLGVGWLLSFPGRLEGYVLSIAGAVSGGGGDVASAGSSLGRIGISLVELGVRLGGVKVVIIGLMGLLTVVLLWRYLHGDATPIERRQLAVALSLVPVGVIVIAFLGMGVSNMWSRYLGLSMTIIAVLAAIGGARFIPRTGWRPVGGPQMAVFLALLVLMSGAVAIIHPSPTVIRPNQHVTESQAAAYGHAFEHGADNVEGLYTVPRNYRDAHYGSVAAARGIGIEQNGEVVGGHHPPDHFADWIGDEPRGEQPRMVSDMSRAVHLELFDGVVQDEEDFAALESHFHKPYDNGASTIYY